MSVIVRKTPTGLYEATITPPHAKSGAWSTTEPMTARQLFEKAKALGCHPVDIADALYEQDPEWVEKP